MHWGLNLITNLMGAHKVRDEIWAEWRAKPLGPPPMSAFCSCCPSRGERKFQRVCFLERGSPSSVCLSKLLPEFCISHKELTKVGLIQIWQCVDFILRGFSHLHPQWQVGCHCLLQAEPLGKPKNTGAGSLSVLQGIFPTQESNGGLAYHLFLLSPPPTRNHLTVPDF